MYQVQRNRNRRAPLRLLAGKLFLEMAGKIGGGSANANQRNDSGTCCFAQRHHVSSPNGAHRRPSGSIEGGDQDGNEANKCHPL
jgi:hypothetical protein